MFYRTFVLLSAIFIAAFTSVSAQDNDRQIKAVEDSLLVTADSMYNAFLPEMRSIHNEKFVKQLVRALKIPGSYNYKFERLGSKINIIYPEDKAFRIFNWSIASSDVTLRYYGALQMPGTQLKLYPLVDYTAEMGKGAEDSILTNGKWFGALYYRIIPQEVNGTVVYTLFGKNASSPLTDKKVLDPLTITDKGPVFGAPIFNVRSQNKPNERVNRFIMEYKKQVQASLNWDNDMNAIFFDRLASDVNDPNRKYTFVPTGQYDGFRWSEGYWNYLQDLIPIAPLKDGEAPQPVPSKSKE
jgi:hypothetical protein